MEAGEGRGIKRLNENGGGGGREKHICVRVQSPFEVGDLVRLILSFLSAREQNIMRFVLRLHLLVAADHTKPTKAPPGLIDGGTDRPLTDAMACFMVEMGHFELAREMAGSRCSNRLLQSACMDNGDKGLRWLERTFPYQVLARSLQCLIGAGRGSNVECANAVLDAHGAMFSDVEDIAHVVSSAPMLHWFLQNASKFVYAYSDTYALAFTYESILPILWRRAAQCNDHAMVSALDALVNRTGSTPIAEGIPTMWYLQATQPAFIDRYFEPPHLSAWPVREDLRGLVVTPEAVCHLWERMCAANDGNAIVVLLLSLRANCAHALDRDQVRSKLLSYDFRTGSPYSLFGSCEEELKLHFGLVYGENGNLVDEEDAPSQPYQAPFRNLAQNILYVQRAHASRK